MSDLLATPVTAFQAGRRLATGPLADVANVVKDAFDRDPTLTTLTFDDRNGAQLDFDLSGSRQEFGERLAARAKYEAHLAQERGSAAPRGRGRPKLGVVAREVTLLPRHWEWLASQPGTASQVLRRLVDEARRADGGEGSARRAREHAYAFISAIGGNLPGFEEATRALFAGDRGRFEQEIATWPADVRDYATRLAWSAS